MGFFFPPSLPAHHFQRMPWVGEGGVRRGSHHGQLSLQLLHPVVLEVQLGAQGRGVVRGLLGLAPQLPLLAFQKVLLLRQSLDGILALLQGESARGRYHQSCGASSGPRDTQRGLDPRTRGRCREALRHVSRSGSGVRKLWVRIPAVLQTRWETGTETDC